MSGICEPLVTKQSMFDDAVRHLLTQNAKAQNQNGCVYYDERTKRKCVMGARIPPGVQLGGLSDATLWGVRSSILSAEVHLQMSTEGTRDERSAYLERVRDEFVRLKSILRVPDELVDFAIALQNVHDGRATSKWPAELRAIGLAHDLDLAVFDELHEPKATENPNTKEQSNDT